MRGCLNMNNLEVSISHYPKLIKKFREKIKLEEQAKYFDPRDGKERTITIEKTESEKKDILYYLNDSEYCTDQIVNNKKYFPMLNVLNNTDLVCRNLLSQIIESVSSFSKHLIKKCFKRDRKSTKRKKKIIKTINLFEDCIKDKLLNV